MDKPFSRKKLLQVVLWVVVMLAIILRVLIYMQNRNLILDEANVARNIYERGFIGLTQPLSYEQYAPPVFLWILKLSTIIAGFSEYALRFYTMVCSIGAVIVFYKVLKRLIPANAIWYALSLFAFCHILIRYSSEVKQYMPDVLITLLLIYLAFKIELKNYSAKKFILYWSVIGSMAVWMSMPSVFVLAGVGMYYFWDCIQSKDYKSIIWVIVPSVIWVAQFTIYYAIILATQANSDYLQNFHHHFFLFATPSDMGQWDHNWRLFSGLMLQFEGLYPYAHEINTVLLIVAIAALFWKQKAKFFLLVVPLFALIAAAALDQFSLMPRVSLFIIPILIIIIGYGYNAIYSIRSNVVKVVVSLTGLYVVVCNIRQTVDTPFVYEEITTGYQYVLDNKVKPNAVGLYHSAVPAHIYYTQMHPNKDKWAQFAEADKYHWYTNYDSLSWQIRYAWQAVEPYAIIYTNATEKEFRKRDSMVRVHLDRRAYIDESYIRTSVYVNPDKMK